MIISNFRKLKRKNDSCRLSCIKYCFCSSGDMTEMSIELRGRLKDIYLMQDFSSSEIPDFMNQDYLKADKQKYMNMYNWMSG